MYFAESVFTLTSNRDINKGMFAEISFGLVWNLCPAEYNYHVGISLFDLASNVKIELLIPHHYREGCYIRFCFVLAKNVFGRIKMKDIRRDGIVFVYLFGCK